MSQLISLSHDKSFWRFEKILDYKWQTAPLPFGGKCRCGENDHNHQYMILNIDGHELEIAAIYQNFWHTASQKGTSTICHLDSSYVGSNGAFCISNGFYSAGSMKSLTEGTGRFMYLEVGSKLVGVSSPRIAKWEIEWETKISRECPYSRITYRMITPIVQVWSRVKPPVQKPFVGSDLIELKRWSRSELRFTTDYQPRYWLGGLEKKSEPCDCNCCSEKRPCDCNWCSEKSVQRFGSSGTAKNNKKSASWAY